MDLYDADAPKWHRRDEDADEDADDATALGTLERVTLPTQSPPSSETETASPAASAAPSPTSSLPYDLNISNGTCYYAPSEPMDPGFIPCGNAASETKACCWTGDVCLGDQACFGIHEGVYTTYMGGCTDAADTLTNDNCPQKPQPYASEPWIGLAYCNGTSDEWIACPQEASPSTIRGAGPCVCPAVTQQRIVAFRDASVLPSYASLPTALGGSVQWLGGYTPTAGTADATGAETGSFSSTPTQRPTAGSSRTPLIVGLAVGLSGMVLLALVGILSFGRKRAQTKGSERGKLGDMGDETMDGGGRGRGRGHGAVEEAVVCDGPKEAGAPQPASTVSELEMRPARPWSLRSELDGFPVAIGSASAGAGAGAGASAGAGANTDHARMGSSYGPLSPMTTGPSLAEALGVSAQMTGSSAVLALTAAHCGQTTSAQRQHDRRPPFETLAELE